MSYQNLILQGDKPYQDLDIHDLRCRNNLTCDGDLIVNDIVGNEVKCSLVDTQSVVNSVALENLSVEFPQARNYQDEYCSFTGSVANVDGVQKNLDSVTITNAGTFPYIADIDDVAKTWTFQEEGLYNISFHILPTSGFLTSEVVNFRFFTEADLGNTRWIECVCAGSGAPGGTAGFTLSGIYPHTLGVSRTFTFQCVRLAGAGTPSFDVKGVITRIK